MRKVKLNNKLLLDTVIASVLVQQAPSLINKYFMQNNPLSGMSLNIAGAGAGYVAGMLLKKPNVSSIAVALVLAELGNDLVAGQFGSPVNPVIPMGQPGSGSPVNFTGDQKFALANRLNEYINASGLTEPDFADYERFYN